MSYLMTFFSEGMRVALIEKMPLRDLMFDIFDKECS